MMRTATYEKSTEEIIQKNQPKSAAEKKNTTNIGVQFVVYVQQNMPEIILKLEEIDDLEASGDSFR